MSIQIESDNLKEGILGLVMAVVEILKDVLQKQAIHRLESGSLNDEEADRLGLAFMKLDEAIEKIKKENNLKQTSDKIRAELDGIVGDALNTLTSPLVQESAK